MAQHDGYTLLETLVTVSVALIVLGMVVPEFTRLIAENRRTAAVNELLGAFQYARLEAIKRNAEVIVCADDGTLACAPAADPWEYGYLVFVDEPPGRPHRIATPEHLLARKSAPAGLTMLANRDAFALHPLRRRSSNGTVRVCPAHPGAAPRSVIVSVTGRPRVSSRLASGAPIPCPAT